MGAFVNDSVVGIVLFQVGTPDGITYIDKFDQVVPAEQLVNVYTPMQGALAVKSATQSCGRPSAFSYWVRVQSAHSTVSVRLLCKYNADDAATYGIDLTGVSPTDWGVPLQMVNQTTGTTASAFTGLTTGLYLFQTASAHTTGLLRWEALSPDPDPTDFVRIGGRVV